MTDAPTIGLSPRDRELRAKRVGHEADMVLRLACARLGLDFEVVIRGCPSEIIAYRTAALGIPAPKPSLRQRFTSLRFPPNPGGSNQTAA